MEGVTRNQIFFLEEALVVAGITGTDGKATDTSMVDCVLAKQWLAGFGDRH